MKLGRLPIVVIILTVVATLYTLNDLHRLSTLHSEAQNKKEFVTSNGNEATVKLKHTGRRSAVSLDDGAQEGFTAHRKGKGRPIHGGHLHKNKTGKPHLHKHDSKLKAEDSHTAAKVESKVPETKGDRKFHIITSAQGSAVHWQCRVHYYWYKKIKAQCEAAGPCDMGGFTRLLHSGKADDLMDEIPTVVVNPLPQEMVEHSWYVVLNRPYAFMQWVKAVTIPEKFVLMAEPDHIFLRPLPNFMNGNTPAAFPFFYIEPKKHLALTQKFTGPLPGNDIDKIAPIGNSPTYMTFEDMQKAMPIWMNVSIAVFKDKEASRVWGWVQEMYGFTFACYLSGIHHIDLYHELMAQPPWDREMEIAPNKPYHILHYTYGMDYKLTGEFTPGKYGEWRWDKRTYGTLPPPRHLGLPPPNMNNKLVRRLIDSINEASAALPCWDEYAKTGRVAPCKETV